MPYVDCAASRLYYEIHGAGPPLVLLHGVGGNHASWFNQIAAFRDRYTLVVLDARGFGNSSDAEGHGRSAFVNDLEILFGTLGLAPAAIVAQSMGGGTAALFTCRHPARVKSLVLADTAVGIELPASVASVRRDAAEKASRLGQLERVFSAGFRRSQPVLSALYLALASFNSVDAKSLPGKQEVCTPAQLAATGVPILFMVGTEDVIFPPEIVRAVQSAVPGSRYAEIPGAGHSPYFEAPGAFNAILEDWFQHTV